MHHPKNVTRRGRSLHTKAMHKLTTFTGSPYVTHIGKVMSATARTDLVSDVIHRLMKIHDIDHVIRDPMITNVHEM